MRAHQKLTPDIVRRPWRHSDTPARPIHISNGEDAEAMANVPLVWCDECGRYFQTGHLLVHEIITHCPAYTKGSVEMREAS